MKKTLSMLFPVMIALALIAMPFLATWQAGSASTVPTFSIVSVAKDQSVTVKTSNFPAGKTWTVRMGPMGTKGVNGTVVGTTDFASGGSFQATYSIPSGLKGSYQIAIRMEANTGGWYAYNWFYNNTSGTGATVTPGPSPTPGPSSTPGYTGIPTFSIVSVVRDASVTVKTSNYPAGKTWTVRMGPMGTKGVNGTVVGTTDFATGGSFTATYNIPSGLKGASQIAIRMEANTGGWYAYNWFYNNTTGVTATPGPSPTPGPTSTPGYSGIPTFSISGVVRDLSVTIKTKNLPPGKTWTVRMGPMGTRGMNGTVAGTVYSASGGTITEIFNIPSGLKGSYQISIRMEADTGGWYAYNWFYNNTYP